MLILIYNAINKWRGKTILIRKPYKTNKNISRLFYILMMIIFVWFIGIQILGPDEQFFDQSGHSIIYNGTFTWKKSDGTKQNISVPGRYKVPAKQTMIITTTLPDDYNENVIAIRSSLQDVRFYIDGKLEKSTMQKVCTDLAKTLPAVIYSAILRLQMPERNFVWNLQHIRVTTLVLSIRFTVEIKCRSGVIFSIITSLEP